MGSLEGLDVGVFVGALVGLVVGTLEGLDVGILVGKLQHILITKSLQNASEQTLLDWLWDQLLALKLVLELVS